MRYFLVYYNKEVGGFFAGSKYHQFENLDDIPWSDLLINIDNNELVTEMNDNTKLRFIRNGYLVLNLGDDNDIGAFLFDFEHEYSDMSTQSTGKGLWNQIGSENLLADKYNTMSKQIKNYIREEKINNLI